MPFPFFPFSFRKRKPRPKPAPQPAPTRTQTRSPALNNQGVRRHFFNERGFQTYGSFFAHWGGYITAGHVVRESAGLLPPFANGSVEAWPDGLDAALIGCQLPAARPPEPSSGLPVHCIGFPAGSGHPALRDAKVYLQRPGAPGTWIAHILTPDEPVVTGMSGGAVFDSRTGEPLGIIITRNSPADLNNDRDPDESLDFIALSSVWDALQNPEIFV